MLTAIVMVLALSAPGQVVVTPGFTVAQASVPRPVDAAPVPRPIAAPAPAPAPVRFQAVAPSSTCVGGRCAAPAAYRYYEPAQPRRGLFGFLRRRR